jgi:hypothetical protein
VRILVSTPPKQAGRLFLVRNDEAIGAFSDTQHRTRIDLLDLMQAVWPGVVLTYSDNARELEFTWYAPRNRGGYLYVRGIGRPTARRFLAGNRKLTIEQLAATVDPEYAEIITLRPVPHAPRQPVED